MGGEALQIVVDGDAGGRTGMKSCKVSVTEGDSVVEAD